MKNSQISKLLNLFVGTNELRPIMLKPFIQDIYYYATDAHACIRIPILAIDQTFEYAMVENPEMKNHFPPIAGAQYLVDVIAIYRSIQFPLKPEYRNPGGECDQCNGEGTIECDQDHMHDCKKCHGKGELLPSMPTGRQIPDENIFIKVGEKVFAYTIFKKLIDACILCDIQTVTLIADPGPLNASRYKLINEIEILLMPINTTSEFDEPVIETDPAALQMIDDSIDKPLKQPI